MRKRLIQALIIALFLLLASVVALYVGACSLLSPTPKPSGAGDRVRALPSGAHPLSFPVKVYWNEYQVPFIEAGSDADVAYALGLVHAHLRLGQMEVLRKISQGKISEMVGPLTFNIDQSLRTLDFGYAAEEIIRNLPAETRTYLEMYVSGINSYIERVPEAWLPFEFKALGLSRAAWSVRDIIVLSRLVGTEINWLFWFRLLELMREPHWQEFWHRRLRVHERNRPSFEPYGKHTLDGPLAELASVSKSGSNSFVVAGAHTKNGAALIASDPHVGFQLPNLWLLVGVSSPSYHALGFMLPGIPAVLLGRNRDIAWGGTNMLALTSSLFKLSKQDVQSLTTQQETIRARWWFSRDFHKRMLPLSATLSVPVISDIPFLSDAALPALALRWVGHEASDEISALLALNRATNFEEFRASFQSYAVSGQNFLYADKNGNIGQVLALKKPLIDTDFSQSFISDSKPQWSEYRSALDLPYAYNPAEGFLASANNRPFPEESPADRVSVLYSSSDRVERIQSELSRLIKSGRPVSVPELQTLQMDVFSPSAFRVKEILSALINGAEEQWKFDKSEAAVVEAINQWDGRYGVESRGAVAFHLWSHHFVSSYYGILYGEKIAGYIAGSDSVYEYVREDLSRSEDSVRKSIRRSITLAAERFLEFKNWGEMHRLKVQGVLGNLPIFGAKFRVGEFGVPGSSTTVLKTFAGLSDGVHYARYGANARHVSDLSDPNENYFVLMGGQDGFLNSDNYADQVPLWLKGQYIKVPFELEQVQNWHKMVSVLGE